MSTDYHLKVTLRLLPEPVSGGTQGHSILHISRSIPLSTEVLKTLLNSHSIGLHGFMFKLEPLSYPDELFAHSDGIGYLSPNQRTNPALLQALVKEGWSISDPSDARARAYPFPEEALAVAEGKFQLT